MQLFTAKKIAMYCESAIHRVEQRANGDVKVVELVLRIDDFDAQLASALNQDTYGVVKRTLFRMSDDEPVLDLRAVEFAPLAARQQMHCYETPDNARAAIVFDQVKVTKVRAKLAKGATVWTFYVHVAFGPVSKTELEYVSRFFASELFTTWEAAEPSLEFEAEKDDILRGTTATLHFDGDGEAPVPEAAAPARSGRRGRQRRGREADAPAAPDTDAPAAHEAVQADTTH